MKFIVVMTRTEMCQGSERKELKRIKFEAPSISAAKGRATKEANRTVFLEEVQSWDNEKKQTTGKDIRWRSWSVPPSMYTQDDGKKIGYSGKSGQFFGLYTTQHGTSPTYYAGVTVYWEITD